MMIPFLTLPRFNNSPIHLRIDRIESFCSYEDDNRGLYTRIYAVSGASDFIALPTDAFARLLQEAWAAYDAALDANSYDRFQKSMERNQREWNERKRQIGLQLEHMGLMPQPQQKRSEQWENK